jgi:endonuclease YncB( thermonuclease family)
MTRAILAFAALLAATAAMAQHAIVGTVTRVKDGDTICIGSVEVRLEGIDAPETGESCRRGARRWKCGEFATRALRDLTAKQTLTCQPKYCDAHGRTVALCRIAGTDVSESMVAAGWAVDWPYYSEGRYSEAEDAAQKAGRGLWADGGKPTLRMLDHMLRPGSRRSRGPWPPCKTVCELADASPH